MSKLLRGLVLLLALFLQWGVTAAEPDLPPVPGGSAMPDIPDNSPRAGAILTPESAAAATTTTVPGTSVNDIPVAHKPVAVGTPEKPLINKIIVRGGFVEDSWVKSQMGTREGSLLDRKVLEEDFQRLYKLGRFADVQIKEEVVPGSYSINVIVLLREKNIIRRIVFRGNKNMSTNKLLKEVKLKVGDRYDEGQATRAARNLEDYYKNKFWYFATVKAEPEPFEDGVRLVFDVSEGYKVWVRDVIFRGNYRFTDKAFKKYMKVKGSTFFTRGKMVRRDFEEDLQRIRLFYQSNGYLDVTVTERPFQITANKPEKSWFGRREIYIYVDIEEGEQYRIGQISFKGNRLVNDNDIRAAISSMPGKIYSPLSTAEDAKLVRDIYGRYPNSRYFTQVVPERVLTEQPNVVDVVFHINESPQVTVEDVQIVGNVKTKDYVIRRDLEFFPGELIDSTKIENSKENLANLDYFKEPQIDVKEGSAPDRARVVVDLEEKSTGNFNFGVGVSTAEPIAGSFTLSQRNFDYSDFPESFKEFITGQSFIGGGQYASASISMGTRSKNLGFDFVNPWIFDKPVSFGFGPFWKTYEWDEFTEDRLGFYTSLGRRLWSKHMKATASYRLEMVDMYDVDSTASNWIAREAGKNWLSSISLNLTWDSRNNIFDPEKGFVATNTAKLYGSFLGGTYDFWSNYTKLQGFYPFFTDRAGRNWVISAKTDFSTMNTYANTDHIPVYEKLYGGGIGSVRGFGSNSLSPKQDGSNVGGLSMQTNSLELFVPVYEKMIKASWFLDAGGVWPDAWSTSGGTEGGPNGGCGYRYSTGPGIHVKTPFSPMPIRLYFPIALNPKPDDTTEFVQFSFGAQF